MTPIYYFKKFEMFLFGISSILTVVYAETVCDGPDYSPLGCFTDRPPFGGLGSGRRGMLPDPIREVQPMFFLSNTRGSEQLIDWQNPSLSSFETNKPVVITSHGWLAIDWWQLEAAEKFDHIQTANYIRFDKKENQQMVATVT